MSQTFGNLKDLSRLMGGAVQERWEDALGRMTRNILDPNTEPRRARKITMVLTIKPTESRDGGEMSFDVKESFAPPTPVKQSVFFDQTDDGTIYATQKLTRRNSVRWRWMKRVCCGALEARPIKRFYRNSGV